MDVLVHHTVLDPAAFWSTAEASIPHAPAGMTLHQTLSARDGGRATRLWEADSVESVRAFLGPALASSSRNEYAGAENREGIALPTRVRTVLPPPTA